MIKLKLVKPRAALKPLHSKAVISPENFAAFRAALASYLTHLNTDESEENAKNLLRAFLENAFYRGRNLINTKERMDYVIHAGNKPTDAVAVIIEAKSPKNQNEMIAVGDANRKAFHELLLYYLQERSAGNIDLKHLIITNAYEWFVFDAADFERLFFQNTTLKKRFAEWQKGVLTDDRTAYFYNEIAATFLAGADTELSCAHFDLREPALAGDDKRLIALYKLLSPEHLLKAFEKGDANSLNTGFYNELLYILGLQEVKEGGKKRIDRRSGADRQSGSLIENTINLLVRHRKGDGANEAALFEKALSLVILWTNRILFAKLLEAQLVRYHGGDRAQRFLTAQVIADHDELDKLFFEVLAKRPETRAEGVNARFGHVPYLNSSLFEAANEEKQLLFVNALDDQASLTLFNRTALADANGAKRSGTLNTLHYLFEFLDAYDFSGVVSEDELAPTVRPLISASVLGLVFEKINGYKDGSYYTPSFITMHMARETLRRAVTDKLNAAFGYEAESFDELYNRIDSKQAAEISRVIDTVTVCDPAVGSGHFLVSALNELIVIKHELGVLTDAAGRRLRDWSVEIDNDELIVRNDEGDLYEYRRPKAANEVQRVQKTLFDEKRRLIENCLFGVDINPNSVNICRLRLWIELLKNAYYTEESGFKELQTLPNIDINIKCGNSLISRYELAGDLKINNLKAEIENYKKRVFDYKENLGQKSDLLTSIDALKAKFGLTLKNEGRLTQKLKERLKAYVSEYNFDGLNDELSLLALKHNYRPQTALFGDDEHITQSRAKERQKHLSELQTLQAQIAEIESGKIYENAFEWRFEFPEALDANGDFAGFDVVIGNPPYIRQEELGAEFKAYAKERYVVYHGMADIYVFFVELGFNLLRENGHISYIFPNKWMRAGYGAGLRGYLKAKRLIAALDFGDLPVFDEATTYPMILLAGRGGSAGGFDALEIPALDVGDLGEYARTHAERVDQAALEEGGWSLKGGETARLMQKIRQNTIPLGEYVKGQIYYGIKTGLNEAFVIDAATREQLIVADLKSAELIKPFLAGRDIKRYETPKADKYLIFTRRGTRIDEYPAIKAHLEQYKDRLMPKPKDHNGPWQGRKAGSYEWWEIQDNVAYWQEFEKPKIIIPAIAKQMSCAFDADGNYSNDKTTIIVTDDLYLLGILNSSVIDFYMKQIASTKQNDYFEYKPMYLEQLPIVPKGTNLGLEGKIMDAAKRCEWGLLDELVWVLYRLNQEK
ncbi:MAG: TaqI-like C-terminal specificity domain-containing protein [Campylobacterales bacterium]